MFSVKQISVTCLRSVWNLHAFIRLIKVPVFMSKIDSVSCRQMVVEQYQANIKPSVSLEAQRGLVGVSLENKLFLQKQNDFSLRKQQQTNHKHKV